jgi:two-component system cell cycle response regulator
MLEGSGFDFIKAVNADQQLADIPFVFIISTYYDETSRRHGLALGAVCYLFRPLDPEVFLAEIDACLRTKDEREAGS